MCHTTGLNGEQCSKRSDAVCEPDSKCLASPGLADHQQKEFSFPSLGHFYCLVCVHLSGKMLQVLQELVDCQCVGIHVAALLEHGFHQSTFRKFLKC